MSLSKEDLTDIRKLIVEGTMEALNVAVIPRLDAMEAHLAQHDQRFDEHDRRFDEIGQRLSSIEARLTGLEGRMEALESDVKELYNLVPDPADDTNATPEQRLRQLYAGVRALARELKVEL